MSGYTLVDLGYRYIHPKNTAVAVLYKIDSTDNNRKHYRILKCTNDNYSYIDVSRTILPYTLQQTNSTSNGCACVMNNDYIVLVGSTNYNYDISIISIDIDTLTETVLYQETGSSNFRRGNISEIFKFGDYVHITVLRNVDNTSDTAVATYMYEYHHPTKTLHTLVNGTTGLADSIEITNHVYGLDFENYSYRLIYNQKKLTSSSQNRFYLYKFTGNTYQTIRTQDANFSVGSNYYYSNRCLEDSTKIYDFVNGKIFFKNPTSSNSVKYTDVNGGSIGSFYGKLFIWEDTNDSSNIKRYLCKISDTPNYDNSSSSNLTFDHTKLIKLPSNTRLLVKNGTNSVSVTNLAYRTYMTSIEENTDNSIDIYMTYKENSIKASCYNIDTCNPSEAELYVLGTETNNGCSCLVIE